MTFTALSTFLQRLRRTSASADNADFPISAATTLPTELILHIFTLASADASFGQASLAAFAQVCTATRPWAEERLYPHPAITSTTQLGRLGKTLKKSSRLASLVEGLTLSGASDPHGPLTDRRNVTASLPAFLKVATSVTHLKISSAAIYSLIDFASAQNITCLTITNTVIADRTSTFSRLASQPSFAVLSSLVSLTLNDVCFLPSTATTFFSHTITPLLRHLELGNCFLEGSKRMMCEIKSSELLAGLEELVLGGLESENEEEVEERRAAVARMLMRCTSLKKLQLSAELSEGEGLAKLLPSSLKRLTLVRWSKMRSAGLRDIGHDQMAKERRGTEREMRRLVEDCEARGVVVELT